MMEEAGLQWPVWGQEREEAKLLKSLITMGRGFGSIAWPMISTEIFCIYMSCSIIGFIDIEATFLPQKSTSPSLFSRATPTKDII